MSEIIGKMSIDVFGNLENRISDLELEKDLKIKKEIYTGECEFDLCFYKGIDAEIKKKNKIIDKMADWLVGEIHDKDIFETAEDVKEYFERKVENGN